MARINLKFSGRLLICVLGTLLLAVPAWTQVGTGSLSGTVTDSTGGVLIGADVTIQNMDTNTSYTAITNNSGMYRMASLPIGKYEVKVSMAGFKTAVKQGIVVSVGSNPVVDVKLELGEITETVTVEADVSQVETQTAAVYNLVTPKQMSELPLNGRNFSQLIMLAPGVQPVAPSAGVAGSFFYGAQENYAIAGSRPEGQAFLLDNTNMVNFWNHAVGSSGTGYSLGVEAIAEFQLLTSTYGAEFGGDGAVVNAATKSGTNNFHGSAYEYARNDAFDARDYFNLNDDGSPAQKPDYTRHQFGFSLGGPIIKNTLFFFGNYEGSRESQGRRIGTSVPMGYVKNGQLPCSALSTMPEGCPESPSGTPGSETNPIVDVPDVVQRSLDILALYPDPSAGITDNGGYANYVSLGDFDTREDYILGRVDYNIGNDDMLYGRYIHDRGRFTNPLDASQVLGYSTQADTVNQFYTMEEKHFFGPQMFNSVRFSFSRTNEFAATTSPYGDGSPLKFYPGRPDGLVNITGIASIGSNIALPYYIVQNKFTVGDSLVWNKGSHTLKIGAQLVRVQTNLSAPAWVGGQYAFTSLEAFLQGSPSTFFGAFPGQTDATRDFREINIAPYIQDDWKFTPKLTLNLGVRWEYSTNAVGVRHPLNNLLDPPEGGFVSVDHVFAKNPNLKNIDPRLGFAYDPFADHKTSIRAGFGIFHNRVAPRTYASGYYFAPPFANVFYATFIPPYTVPYPNSFPDADPNNPPAPGPIQLFAGVDYNIDSAPYMVQYNLTIQREIWQKMVLSIGYVGSQGHNLFTQNDVNPVMCNTPGTEAGSAPTTDCASWDSTFDAGDGIPNPRVNPANLSMMMVLGNSDSNYNSLQVGLIRRMTKHISGQISYTWGKSLDNGSVTSGLEQFSFPRADSFFVDYDYGRSAFDVRQNLVVNSLIDLPFSGNRLVEGWQISQILSTMSGMPINILEGYDNTGLGPAIQSARPSYAFASGCDPNRIIDAPVPVANRLAPGAIQWFDPMCYETPGYGSLGNVTRNSLDAPGVLQWDLTFKKDTKISEGKNVEFRAEMFNIINHPMFATPAGSVFNAPAFGSTEPTRNSTAGQITATSRRPRQIQFAVKFTF